MRPTNSSNSTGNPDRTAARLASKLDKQLSGYAAAAAAAGVGLLALAHPAEAKIIFTPSNIPIPVNGGIVQFDVNHDGIPEFGLSFVRAQHLQSTSTLIRVIPAQDSNSNQVGDVFGNLQRTCAAELGKRNEVGPGRHFQGHTLYLSYYIRVGTLTYSGCNHEGNDGGFLALKFVANGETYYGWARFSLVGGVTLTGYAYENVPNRPILTGATDRPDDNSDASPAPAVPDPQPASLGALARGSLGLSIWRRPEESN